MTKGIQKNSIGSTDIFETATFTTQTHEEYEMKNEIANGKNDVLNSQVEGQQMDIIDRESSMVHGNPMKKNEPIVSMKTKENVQVSQYAKKGHRALVAKLSQLKELILNNLTQEQICKKMNISISTFGTLYFMLTQRDNCHYKVSYISPMQKGKIGENGLSISNEKISFLGLEHIFRKGMEIHFSAQDQKIIIEVADSQRDDDQVTDIFGSIAMKEAEGEENMESEFPELDSLLNDDFLTGI